MIRIEKLDRALASLEKGLEKESLSDLERDGIIQRFEYCFELTWKLCKQFLLSLGIGVQSPKMAIREAARQGLIDNPTQWLEYLNARNYTSHTYDEAVAQWVFLRAKSFAIDARALLDTINTRMSES